MTLVQQFPDVSMRQLHQKKIQKKIAHVREDDDSDKTLKAYYDNEFRKWHYKLALIIGFMITCLLGALVGVAKLF